MGSARHNSTMPEPEPPKLTVGDWVEFWTGEYEFDFDEDEGYPIRIPIWETGRVDRVTEDTVWVVPDSDPGSEPKAVPRHEEWVWLNELGDLSFNEDNIFTYRWYLPEERREKVTEVHGAFHDPEFWKEHGIKPEVAKERGYSRWFMGHAKAPLEEAYAGIELKPQQFTWFWTSANHANGIIIMRHKPPAVPGGEEYPRIFPEIRPDRPVPTRPPTKHYHGDEDYEKAIMAGLVAVELPTGEVIHPGEEGYEKAVKVHEKHIHRPTSMTNHLNKRHPDGNVQTVHYHPHEAKYIFAPSPIKLLKFTQAHKDMKRKKGEAKPENYDNHLRKWHPNDTDDYIAWCWDNEHDHWYEGKPKGIYYDEEEKPRGHDYARRVDVHPWAGPLIKEHKRVFFGIEGCLKADAILSQDAAVFSVPSVSLWEAPELPQFIEDYLMGKQVIIVPDAD